MKFAVIGSNSFSGAHFVSYLLQRPDVSEVVGISRAAEYDSAFLPYKYKTEPKAGRFQFHQLDVNHHVPEIVALLDKTRPDYIVNLAAQGEVRNSWKWPAQWYQTNALGIVNLTNALVGKNYLQKYVQISTPEVYGATGLDIRESHNYFPSTPYAASKLAGDAFLFALQKHYQFPTAFTRAANVYGPHQQLFRIIPKTIAMIKMNKKLDLHGRGKGIRSFIHMQDVAAGTFLVATKSRPGEIYHIAPRGAGLAIADIVKLICRLMGRNFDDSVNMMDENFGQDAMYSLNADKIRTELGWQDQISLEQGIQETIQWMSDSWGYLEKQSFDYVHRQ